MLIISSVELDIIVYGHEQEVKEELLDTKLRIGPVLLIEMLVKLTFAECLALLLNLCSKSFKAPVFLVHDVFESSEQVVSVGLRKFWYLVLGYESSLL